MSWLGSTWATIGVAPSCANVSECCPTFAHLFELGSRFWLLKAHLLPNSPSNTKEVVQEAEREEVRSTCVVTTIEKLGNMGSICPSTCGFVLPNFYPLGQHLAALGHLPAETQISNSPELGSTGQLLPKWPRAAPWGPRQAQPTRPVRMRSSQPYQMKVVVPLPAFSSVRELFEAAREASKEAERIRRQLELAEHDAVGVRSPTFEPMVRSGGGDSDRIGRAVAAKLDLEERLREREAECYAVIDSACAVIYGDDSHGGLAALVTPWWADALWWHYLGGETWQRVGEILGYGEHRCWEVAQIAMEIADANGMQRTVAGIGIAEAD